MKSILIIVMFIFSGNVFSNERFEHPTQVIAFLNSDIKTLSKSLNNINQTIINVKELGDSQNVLISVPTGFKIDSFKNQLLKNKNINKIVPNFVYLGEYREFKPNDPEIEKQNHHIIIKNYEAWELSEGVEEIVVAVTDDGFKLDHEDLLNSWNVNENEIPRNGIDDDHNGYIDDVNGYDFNEQDNDPMSDSRHGSHGTHVSGIVAAGFNNQIGVSGFGSKIKVMPIKFYGENNLTSAMVLESYTYAANNGAKIITTSYYIDNFVGDAAYEKALDYAYDKGLILFNSAGNGNIRQSKRTLFSKLLLVASTKSKKSWKSKIDKRSKFSKIFLLNK